MATIALPKSHKLLENKQYKRTSNLLYKYGYTDCLWELKVVRGGTFNPSIMEKHQILHSLSEHTYYKMPDVGYDKKPGDAFHLSTKYIVLLWQDHNDLFMIIDARMSRGEIYERSYKLEELKEKIYVRTLNEN